MSSSKIGTPNPPRDRHRIGGRKFISEQIVCFGADQRPATTSLPHSSAAAPFLLFAIQFSRSIVVSLVSLCGPKHTAIMQSKILIVDDNSELLTVLRLGFKEAGFTVRTADNGADALKKVRSFAPDLILLDLVLPEMDGFAICETLKKNSVTTSIPIVVLTGLSSQLSRFAGLESGADEYLTKPFNFDEVLTKVNRVLERTRASEPQTAACASPA
jgi:CheY-like chemotaxis protein